LFIYFIYLFSLICLFIIILLICSYIGNFEARKNAKEFDFFFSNTNNKIHIPKFNVLLTTYDMVRQDKAALTKCNYQAMILDEGHRLKSDA